MPLNEKIAQLLRKPVPPLHTLGIAGARKMADRLACMSVKGEIPVCRVEDMTIQTLHKETFLRVYFPPGAGPFPGFVFLHGGGWSVGSIDHYDNFCRFLSSRAECAVVAVEYGLAPEHKFPLPLEECYSAIKWVCAHSGELDLQRDNIAVGGDSAGGNLSAAICLLARERREFDLVYQVLLYPVTDIDAYTTTKKLYGRGYFIDHEDAQWFCTNYLRTPQEARSQLASPLRAATLAGLPDTLLITAEFDPLRDEGEDYGRRLQLEGVPVVHKRFEGMTHAFLSLEWLIPQETREAMGFVADHLKIKFQER